MRPRTVRQEPPEGQDSAPMKAGSSPQKVRLAAHDSRFLANFVVLNQNHGN